MPRLPVHSVETAPEESREALKALEARTGKVLNIYGEMAASPAVLNAYAAMKQAIVDHSNLDATTRQAIALAVANVDGCEYCQAAHTVAGRAAGLDDDLMLEIRRGELTSDPRLAALVDVVREAAERMGEVGNATWEAARSAGWSDRELADAFASIVANLFTNYFNHYVGTDLDLPAAPALDPSS
ncbi:MAG: carboxymuconolactone decarboxylase family protein [Actinomycetota bacterium]|nr:carboxymuconolactone decarboxylase family protein [Actinomycetota bacterium]